MKLIRILSILGLVALALSTTPVRGQTITTEMVLDALRSDSVDRQKAAIAYLSEGAIKTVKAEAIRGDLLKLFQRTNDLTVKGAIVRVLAQIPDFPIDFAEKFKPYLRSASVEIRRGAANGVASVVKTLIPSEIRNIAPVVGVDLVAGSGVWVQLNSSFIAFEDACTHFLPLADMALRDSDSEVRLAGTDAIRHIGVTISNSLPHPASIRDNERVINIDDNRRIWIALLPTMERLNAVTPDLRFAMLDSSVETRKGAALAASAVCSAKRLAYATRTYQMDTFEGTLPEPANPFATGIRNLLPHLVAQLKDRSPEVRLTAMEAVEFLENDAMPEIDGVVAASKDSSVFVRWVAARSLGKMVPKTPLMEDGAKAIAALGEMLSDVDIDVRKAALTALSINGTCGVRRTGCGSGQCEYRDGY